MPLPLIERLRNRLAVPARSGHNPVALGDGSGGRHSSGGTSHLPKTESSPAFCLSVEMLNPFLYESHRLQPSDCGGAGRFCPFRPGFAGRGGIRKPRPGRPICQVARGPVPPTWSTVARDDIAEALAGG